MSHTDEYVELSTLPKIETIDKPVPAKVKVGDRYYQKGVRKPSKKYADLGQYSVVWTEVDPSKDLELVCN